MQTSFEHHVSTVDRSKSAYTVVLHLPCAGILEKGGLAFLIKTVTGHWVRHKKTLGPCFIDMGCLKQLQVGGWRGTGSYAKCGDCIMLALHGVCSRASRRPQHGALHVGAAAGVISALQQAAG